MIIKTEIWEWMSWWVPCLSLPGWWWLWVLPYINIYIYIFVTWEIKNETLGVILSMFLCYVKLEKVHLVVKFGFQETVKKLHGNEGEEWKKKEENEGITVLVLPCIEEERKAICLCGLYKRFWSSQCRRIINLSLDIGM